MNKDTKEVAEAMAAASTNTENINDSKSRYDIISDIPLEIKCVLGRSSMTLKQILKLSKGSVIELDRSVGEPIDLLVNGKLVAKGEVVIVEEKIGITLTEVMRPNKDG